MNQLLKQLRSDDFTLLVSLPKNDLELARAALDGGAQGLKVHVNVEHFASGTRFGSFCEERDTLAKIVELASTRGASCGVVPGTGQSFATEDEFAQMAGIGLDYFDAYPSDAPAWTLTQTHLDVMLAAFHGGDFSTMAALQSCGMAMCEASIVPHEEYGGALTSLDVARYAELARVLAQAPGAAPIIVPSQKKIVPRDVSALRASGAKGLLIGAIVTGRDAESLRAATQSFRDAIG